MSAACSLWRSAATAVALFAAIDADAQTVKYDAICVDGKVDREKLAAALLKDSGISIYPLMWIANGGATAPGDPALSAAWKIISDADFCQKRVGPKVSPIELDKNGTPKCDTDDAEHLGNARGTVVGLFADGSGFSHDPGVEADTYMKSPGAVLRCVSASQAASRIATETVKEPKFLKTFPLRIRGSTDGLQYGRTDDRFTGVDKAALSLDNDGIKSTKTFKVTGVVGYDFRIPATATIDLVPYFGFDINRTTKKDGTVDTKDSTFRAGLLLSRQDRDGDGANLFVLRPEYAVDRTKDSKVLSATLSYLPVRRWANEALPLGSYVSILPKFDLRVRAGTFLKQGSLTDDESRDFFRVGTQLGFTASSGLDWLPVEFTTTWTYLHGFAGSPRDLSQLNLVFSAYADAKKYFGIDVGYKRGRTDDLLSRDREWSIGLGAKF